MCATKQAGGVGVATPQPQGGATVSEPRAGMGEDSLAQRWLSWASAWSDAPWPRRVLAEAAVVAAALALATLVGVALDRLGLGADAIVIVYVLSVQLVSLVTVSHVTCGVATALSVGLFCFFFTDPRYHLVAWGSQYPGTFAVMCVVAVVSSVIAMRLRQNARDSRAASHMMHVLLQTNHALQRCDSVESVMGEAGRQLARLVSGTVVLYLPNGAGMLEPGALFRKDGSDAPIPDAGALDGTGVIAGPRAARQPNFPIEVAVAMRAYENDAPAGSGTALFSSAAGLYLPVGEKDKPLGVFAVLGQGGQLSQGERDMARAVAGETSLALGRELPPRGASRPWSSPRTTASRQPAPVDLARPPHAAHVDLRRGGHAARGRTPRRHPPRLPRPRAARARAPPRARAAPSSTTRTGSTPRSRTCSRLRASRARASTWIARRS